MADQARHATDQVELSVALQDGRIGRRQQITAQITATQIRQHQQNAATATQAERLIPPPAQASISSRQSREVLERSEDGGDHLLSRKAVIRRRQRCSSALKAGQEPGDSNRAAIQRQPDRAKREILPIGAQIHPQPFDAACGILDGLIQQLLGDAAGSVDRAQGSRD